MSFGFPSSVFELRLYIVKVDSSLFSVVCSQNCDPGVCAGIPGLVYNAELDQCAWPDEVGCSLKGKFIVANFAPPLNKRWWYNGQHSCLPSSWSEFDSRPSQNFFCKFKNSILFFFWQFLTFKQYWETLIYNLVFWKI